MIFVVRHGQTHWNAERRLQGHRDSTLTDEGIRQVRAFAQRLEPLLRELRDPPLRLVSSPSERTRQTTELLCHTLALDLPCEYDARLMEHGYGAWEGLTWDEIGERYPEQREAREADRWSYVIPGGGESLSVVWQRARRWLADVPHDRPVLAVTHGTTSRALRGAYLNLSPPEILALDHHTQDRMFLLHDGRVETLLCKPGG